MLDTELSIPEPLQQAALAIAHQYLQIVKGWRTEEYSLEAIRMEGDQETPVVIFDGIYLADLHSNERGGGESVQLFIDLCQQKVVRVQAYQ
jgi:hypothetical protein